MVHKTSLMPPLLIEVPVSSEASEQSCMRVCLRCRFCPFSVIFLLDYGNVPTVWYFCFLSYYIDNRVMLKKKITSLK